MEPQAHLTRRSRGGGTEAMELAPGAGPSPVSWSPQLTSTVRRGPRCVSGDSVAPERVLLKRRGAVYGGRPTRPGKTPRFHQGDARDQIVPFVSGSRGR